MGAVLKATSGQPFSYSRILNSPLRVPSIGTEDTPMIKSPISNRALSLAKWSNLLSCKEITASIFRSAAMGPIALHFFLSKLLN